VGVPVETIFQDYELTEKSVDLEKELFSHQGTSVGFTDDHAYLAQIGARVREPLLKSPREYLQAAFEQMTADHGSVQGYLRDSVGVSAVMLDGIKSRIVE
jgi:protein tyrosine/serine phosphatase